MSQPFKCLFNKETNVGEYAAGAGSDVVVSDTQYMVILDLSEMRTFINEPNRYYYVNGRLEEVLTWQEDEAARINLARISRKKAEIRKKYGDLLKDLVEPYSDEERETWGVQKEEALAWTADPLYPVPMITNMAQNRGISVELMVSKILENAELYKAAAGQLLGLQQKELDEVV